MIKLSINGTEFNIDSDPKTPLLWVLRDELQLTGTKFSCGIGICGACTVHLDGRAIRSCITPVELVDGKSIRTIEGLKDQLPELQEAWLKYNVPQCGFCQPGQLMSASALLLNNAAPKDKDIRDQMSGNLCRCGTYPRIEKAIKYAIDLRQEGKEEQQEKTEA